MIEIYTYADSIRGRMYGDVKAELEADGFVEGKRINIRDYERKCLAGRKIIMQRGQHEQVARIEIEHEWMVDKYGIGHPGKIVSATASGYQEDYGV